MMDRIAFLGPVGTYSHQAALMLMPAAALVPCPAIPDVFSALAEGRADGAVVPVENSLEGSVSGTLDELLSMEATVLGELILPVSHCLVAPHGRHLPDIRNVHSHPQALGQCRGWLKAHLPGALPVQRTSTSEAARICAEDPHGAAIASRLAAQLHGLQVLAEDVQDRPDNATRFLLVGHGCTAPTGNDRTSLLVRLPDKPGALLSVLQAFAHRGLNLSRIESRPSRRHPWEYDFFIDVTAHVQDPPLAEALAHLASEAIPCRMLGAYPRSR